MVLTASYLLFCKWDFTTLSCFPVQEISLTTVGHFTIPEKTGEVSNGSGRRQWERPCPMAEHTAVRALSLPPFFSTYGLYVN